MKKIITNLKQNKKTGKIHNVAQDKWSLENVAKGIKSFYSEYGEYPTATDFDSYSKLPSARHVQRKFHGLKKLRETLKFREKDFTKGSHSSLRGEMIQDRQKRILAGIYRFLVKKLDKNQVQSNFSLTDDTRSRVDFKLRNEAQNCAVDVFYSKDDRTLIGCINGKQNKYSGDNYHKDPVIFLSTNKTINQERVDLLVSRKKKKLSHNHYVLAWESFEGFLNKFSKNKKVSDILSSVDTV
jgi:hypothetical protein